MSVPRTPDYIPRAERTRRRCDMGITSAFVGHDYTPEEVEFLRAISNFKTSENCINPSARDILEIVRNLGYRKEPR